MFLSWSEVIVCAEFCNMLKVTLNHYLYSDAVHYRSSVDNDSSLDSGFIGRMKHGVSVSGIFIYILQFVMCFR